jgi:hypothetical protein
VSTGAGCGVANGFLTLSQIFKRAANRIEDIKSIEVIGGEEDLNVRV